MTRLRRATLLLATTTLMLAACGGGGGASSAPSAAPSSGTASSAPGETPAASSAAPVSAAPSAGGGTAAGVCELATPEELAAAFGVASVATQVLPGPPDTCIVDNDAGRTVASWNYNPTGATAIFELFVLPGQSTDVPGIGDRAAFVENTGLMILKGDAMVVVVIAGGADLEEEAANEVAKQIGAAIAGRM